jgi:hypothetical protein
METVTSAGHSPRIDEALISTLRKEIGKASEIPQFNRFVTEDAVRHYALGLGDDNERWTSR